MQVPVYGGPKVQESSTPTPQERPGPTGGEDFGRGLQRLGAGLENAARKQKEEMDDARVMDAYSQLGGWQNENIFHPEKGALAVRGEDALGLSDQALAKFDEFAGRLNTSLADDGQRSRFQKILLRERETTFRTLSRHETGEIQNVKEEKYKAALDTATSKAANLYADPEALKQELTMGQGAVILRGQQLGWTGEKTRAELARFSTRFHLSVLDRMTDAGEGQLAADYLKAHGEQIDGETRGKSGVDKVVAGLELKTRSAFEAARIQQEAGPQAYDVQMGLAAKVEDPELRDAIVARLDKTRVAQENGRRAAEDQRLGRVYQQIHGNGGHLDKTSKDFQLLSDEAKAKAMDKAFSIRASRTSRAGANRVDEIALATFDALNVDDQLTINPDVDFPEVSDLGRQKLLGRLKKVRAARDKGLLPKQQEVKDKVNSAAKRLGLNKAATERFRGYVLDQWYERLEDDKKPPTSEDLTKIIGEALQYGDADGGSLLSKNKYRFQADGDFKAFPAEEQRYPGSKDAAPAADNAPAATPAAGALKVPSTQKPSKKDRALQLRQQGKSNAEIANTLSSEGY